MSLDLLTLTSVLEQANRSGRSEAQRAAEAQLKRWEKEQGYHYLLQSVYIDLSLPLQTRWLAIINFKNGVEKYWRSSRVNAISTEEKQQIKQRLFELIDEPNRQLAVQNAQAISRVCRFDFPSEWPSLFDDVESVLQSSLQEKNNVKIHNMLVIVNQLVKNLAMAKIGRVRPALQSKAPLITPLLIKLYTSFFEEWVETIDFALMEIGYLSLKVMKRLVTDVYDNPHQSPELVEFMSLSLRHFQLLIQNYDKYAPSEVLEKYIKCYSKVYSLLCKANPTNFILLPCSRDILYTLLAVLKQKAEVVYGSEEEDGVWEFLSIKTLLIFKTLINYLFKRGAVLSLKSRSNKHEVENAIHVLTNEFFSEELIKSLTDLLIGFYIKLKPSDLEAWKNEPEEWANDEVNQNYEYQVRQCAENFFQDLMINFKDLLVPYVMGKVQAEMASYTESSVQNILLKDSVFSIFELSANSLADQIDFNDLCERVFFPEALKNDLSENRILKRRVCLLINEWNGLGAITPAALQRIYALLLEFLNPENTINDKVVQLTAIQALKTIITDWDFQKEPFGPFIKPFASHLLRLTNEMALTESKLFLLNTIADLINRTNPLISQDELNQLLAIVPVFWQGSNDANELILKNSLLRILKSLAISLNQQSHTTWEIALPLISVCCSPGSGYYSLLSEDGYELWLAVLQYLPASQDIPPSLVNDLQAFFMDALMNQTEILPLILEILRSYTILLPQLFVEQKLFGSKIFEILAKYLPQMRDDALDIFLSYMEILLLEQYGNAELLESLLSLMMESGLLPQIVQIILDDDQSHITIGKLLLVVARIAYIEPQSLVQVFQYIYKDQSQAQLNKLDLVWYARMDANISNPRSRKIHVLGLTALLRTGDEVFLRDIRSLLGLWVNSLEEVYESNGDCEKYHSNYLYEFKYNDDLVIQENGEYIRFQQLFKQYDPVHNTELKQYIKATLQAVKGKLGNGFDQWIGTMDANLVENVQYFMGL